MKRSKEMHCWIFSLWTDPLILASRFEQFSLQISNYLRSDLAVSRPSQILFLVQDQQFPWLFFHQCQY